MSSTSDSTTYLVNLCGGMQLLCGTGNTKKQEADYTMQTELPFTGSVNQPLPFRFASSSGGGETQPLREAKGYCTPVTTQTIGSVAEFLVANKHVANVNMAYECILGLDSFDMPSAVAIDLDNKKSENFSLLPSLEYTWNVEKFLDWVLPDFLAALNELCPTLDPPLSERDLYVSDASKPFRAENVQDYEAAGRPISLHVKVDRVMFANQTDRSAFAQFIMTRLHHLSAFIDPKVYGRIRNMRLLGSQKFNKQPLMPYVRDGRYKDQNEYTHWSDIPAETIARHCWSLPSPSCVRLFSDDTVGPFLPSSKPGRGPGKGTRRVRPQVVAAGANTAQDPRVSAVLGVYGEYARSHGVPFEVSDATYNVTCLDGDDFEVYVQHKSGTTRTCPLGREHDSNNYKLVVHGYQLFYFCFSAPPPGCGTVQLCPEAVRPTRELADADLDGLWRPVQVAAETERPGTQPIGPRGARLDCVMLPSCRTAGRNHCCEVYVGDLPFEMFEVPTDWERAPRADRNGVLREDAVTPQVEAALKEIVAKAAGCSKDELRGVCVLVRSSYGSGKTQVWVLELITDVLRRCPTARIAYVANSIALTVEKCEEINKFVAAVRLRPKEWLEDESGTRRLVDWSKIPADWCMVCYDDEAIRPATDSVALCSQSAPKFCGNPFDLVVFDEINGQLGQVIGLERPHDVLQGMQQLARNSVFCVALDSNGDQSAVQFLKSADRKPVILDTPGTTAFAGRTLTLTACLNDSGLNAFEVNRAATFQRVVKDAVDHTGPVAIACSTKSAVRTVVSMLRRAGVAKEGILCMSGADSDATKRAFVAAFGRRDATTETDQYKAYVFSPAVTGGVSNFSCKLQLSLVCRYGPSIEQLRQQGWRTRGADTERVYVLDSDFLYARAPQVDWRPVESSPPDRTGELVSLFSLKQQLRCQAMRRHVLGLAMGPDAELKADKGARSWTRRLVDTHYATADGKIVRCQLGQPPSLPTLDEVELDACRAAGLARVAAKGDIGAVLHGTDYHSYLCEAREDRFGTPRLLDTLKMMADLEKQQRTANFIPFLRADCTRLGVTFLEPEVIALDAKQQIQAQAELCNCLVQSSADLVLADIHFYKTVMRGLDPALLHASMVTICAAKAISGKAGDKEVVKDAHKKAHKLLASLSDTELRADLESCIDEDDDYYATNMVLSLDPLLGSGEEGNSEQPSESTSDHDVALLQLNRLWYAMLSWSDRNLMHVFEETQRSIKAYRTAERAFALDGADDFKQEAARRTAKEAVKSIRQFNCLFRRDAQSRFRSWASVYDMRKAGKRPAACIDELGCELPASKRQKADATMLLLHATDLALITTGVKDGLFAKPEPTADDTHVNPFVRQFFATEAAVQSNYDNRKGPFGKASERTAERLAEVKRISAEVSLLCKGPIARTAKVAFHESKPMENLSSLCSKAAAPMQMSLARAKTKRGGDREVQKDSLLGECMFGEHTRGLHAVWESFEEDKSHERKGLDEVSKLQRQEAVVAALSNVLLAASACLATAPS